MALKDSILNLNKALKCTLQNVPAVVDTLTKGLKDVADATEDQQTYSAEERVIGKWVDGSTLYEKCIDFGTLPTANQVKSLKIDDVNIVDVSGTAIGTDYTFPIPYIYQRDSEYQTISVYAAKSATGAPKDTIRITTNTNRSDTNGYIIIRYTKPAATRSPENESVVKTIDDPVEAPAEELKK